MEAEDIDITDLTRILFGEVPGEFYLEVVIRVLFIYLLMVFSMRMMGKRMAAQLDKVDMAALVSFAAAIGVPLQVPERGLLPAIVIAVVVIIVGKTLFKLAFKSERFERLMQDYTRILVDNGVMDIKMMRRIRMTRERLFAQLRSEGIKHLGEVEKMYAESSGKFSVVRRPDTKPGLAVLPGWDQEYRKMQLSDVEECLLCESCGNEVSGHAEKCENCGSDKRVPASLENNTVDASS